MALIEQNGSRAIEVSKGRAATGQRIFVGDWSTAWYDSPAMGQSFPGYPFLRVVHVSITPFGKTKDGVLFDEYTKAKVVADYSTLRYDDSTDSRGLDFTCDVLEVGGGRTWHSDNAAVDQPMNMLISTINETIERTVLTVPINTIRTLQGKINEHTWRGWPRGTCLFLGANSRTEWDSELMVWKSRMTYNFSIKDLDHNIAWRADTGEWDYPNELLYTYADLSALETLT